MRKLRIKQFFASFAILLVGLFSFIHPTYVFSETNTDSFKSVVDEEIFEKKQEVLLQQEEQMESRAILHPDLAEIAAASNREVDVIVQLSEAPVAFEKGKKELQHKTFSASEKANVLSKVESQHIAFRKELTKSNIQFKEKFTYKYAFNGMAMTVNANDLDKLSSIPGVVMVEPDEEVRTFEDVTSSETVTPFMDTSTDFLGVEEIWNLGHFGENVRVAVLDTGIDYDHPEFEGIYKGGYNFVIHDSRYARDRADDDPYETSPLDRAEGVPEFDEDGHSFYTNHGTHVAGTIAAIGNNQYGIKGLAPKVDLYAYRVLGAYGSGQFSWVIAGIDKAVEEEMDIINLSLGGSSNSSTTSDAIALNNAALAGVTSVVANGNTGPSRGSVGSPATAALAISVGNSTNPETTISADIHVNVGDEQFGITANMMGWTYGSNPEDVLEGTYEIVTIPGLGEPSDYEGIEAEGKIVLVSRGEIPFIDKIAAAKNAGAVGIIIHNHLDGEGPADITLGDTFNFIPTFDISTADGQALREAIDETEEKKGEITFINFVYGKTEGDEINVSSSRGPSTPYFDIKPDVVAPGTNIMSSVPAYKRDFPDASYDQAYDRATGTSMAAPHVTGVAALLLSANPDWTPFDLKVAIANTAKQLNTTEYDVFAQGSGRVAPVAALKTNVLAYAVDVLDHEGEEEIYEKGAVTFGRVVPESEAQKVTKTIEVRDLGSGGGNYDVSIEYVKRATGDMAEAEVSVDKSSFQLNGKEELTVTLSVPAGEGSPNNELLGYIYITNGETTLKLPFAALLSKDIPMGLSYYYLDDYAISPNGDGILESTRLNFGLFNDHAITYIELWDASNPFGGEYGDGYIGYYFATLAGVPAGDWYLEIDDEYVEWGTGIEKRAPEGVYTVDFSSLNLLDGSVTFAWEPLFIKTSEPAIEVESIPDELHVTNYELSGQINDKFVHEFKPLVENVLGLPYDVNNKLIVTYELIDESGELVDSGQTSLEEDGTFRIQLGSLPYGSNTVTIFAEDIAGNKSDESVQIIVKPRDFNVTLSLSTTAYTEDPVTVHVETDSEFDLAELRWLPGEREIADFAEAGEDIPIDKMSFTVSENGAYTVYAKNEVGAEAIEVIYVDNIVLPMTVTLSLDSIEETEDGVTIRVDVDSEVELAELKWLQGEKTAEAFAEAGNDIDLETMSFYVTENGTYTVYVKNIYGMEAVQTIEVTNIVEGKDPDDIGDPDDKQDPDPADKQDPTDKDDKKGTKDDKDGKGKSKKKGIDVNLEKDQTKDTEKLPKTATANYNYLVLGFILFIAGSLIFYYQNRKKRTV